VRYSGALEVDSRPDGVELRSLGDNEIQALGVSVRMDRSGKVEFRGLANPPPAGEPAAGSPK
jgi:hypothetical protein